MAKIQSVENYIKKLRSPQKEICQKLRRIILKAFPKIDEKMWVGVPWYEGKFYIVGLKDHVNLGVCIKGLTKKELTMLEGAGKTMRHLKFFTIKDLNEKNVVKILKMIR